MDDWIERIFHVSPDAGNGSLELLFIVSPIAALLIGLVGLFWMRRRRKKRSNHD
jgi:LPXTG-motif cell wall-anchored protein